MKSYFEKLIWPPLPPKVLDQPDPRDTEVPIGPTIPVHFPTLFRSRCYIEEEMRLQGPHRRWRPNEADDPLDEEQDASVEDEDVFPNFMVSMGMHSLIVYVVRVKHQWIVSGSRDHSFKIWRIPEMEMDGSDPMYGSEVVHTEAAHESSVIALEFEVEDAFNPGKGLIVTGSSDHTVKVWEVEWGHEAAKGWEGIIVTLKATLAGHSRTVTGIGITDKYLVTCSHDLRVFSESQYCLANVVYDRQSIYSSKTVAVLHEASVSVPNGGFPTGLALSPDKTKVSLAGYEGSNVFVDLPSGEVTIEQQPPAHTSHIYSVDWVEGLHGCGGCGGTVQLTQTQPRRFVTWAGRATSFRTMRLVPELNLVMCAGHNGIIQTWPYNFSASRETETVEGPMRVYNFPDPQPIYSIDRSGTYLVAAAGRCVYFIVHGVGKPYANLF